MHGSHYLNDEYKISASRLDPLTKSSTEDYSFCRSKSKSFSSPAYEDIRFKRFLKRIFSAMLALILLIIVGIFKYLSSANTLKLLIGSQRLISYITPQFLMFKRSIIQPDIRMRSFSVKPTKIIEILPVPLHLVIALNLNYLDEASEILKIDKSAHLIIPTVDNTMKLNFLMNERIHFQPNATSLFETLAFSWCQLCFQKQKYPTKLSVIGPSKASACVLNRYRWALKIPKSFISYHTTNVHINTANNSTSEASFSDCSADPFDCLTTDREEIRLKFSKMCPDMSPILLACNNRITLERALSYNPPWALNKHKQQ